MEKQGEIGDKGRMWVGGVGTENLAFHGEEGREDADGGGEIKSKI